ICIFLIEEDSPEFQTLIRPSKFTGDIRRSQSYSEQGNTSSTDIEPCDSHTDELIEPPMTNTTTTTTERTCNNLPTVTFVELTEECKLVTGLTDEMIVDSGSLNDAIYKNYLRELSCNSWDDETSSDGIQTSPTNGTPSAPTDDANTITNMDLGSEFGFQHPSADASDEVTGGGTNVSNDVPSSTTQGMQQRSEIGRFHAPSITPGLWPIEYCRSMAGIIERMSVDGADWSKCELIQAYYQPAIVGINISQGGISLVLSKIGRRNGEALIRFTDREQRDLALRKHKHHMGQRYIEVYAAQGSDFIAFAGGETEEAEQFLRKFTSPYQALIRMRGLPYTATTDQIIQFFAKANCPVQFGEEGVLFVNRRDGRATGDAFVIFESQAVAEEALKSHRQHIGNRYIELFKSTPAEVNQVMNAVLNPPESLTTNWNGLALDVESALNAAAAMAAGSLIDLAGTPNSVEYSNNLEHQPNTDLLSHFTFNLSPQALGLGCQLLGPGPSFHPFTGSGNVLVPSYYQPSNFGSMPVSNIDPMFYSTDHLPSFNHIQANSVLLSTDSGTNNLSSFAYPVPLVSLSTPSGVTHTTTSITGSQPSVWPYSGQTNQWAQWAAGGLNLPMDHLAKYFIRIKGMPLDTDILDILAFLEDSWRNVALHGVHRVYNILFVSEYVAQSVVEQKNGTLFIRRGAPMNSTAFVEVHQCTSEDLKQLLVTILTMLQNVATTDNSLIRPAPTVLNGLNPLVPLSVPTIPLSNPTTLSNPPSMIRPSRMGNVGRYVPDVCPISINTHHGLLTVRSSSMAPTPPITQPPTAMTATTASLPLTFSQYSATPLTTPAMAGIARSEDVNSVPVAPVLTPNLQPGSLVDLPSPMLLHGILPSIPPPQYVSPTAPGAIATGTSLQTVVTSISTGYRDMNNSVVPRSIQAPHLEPATLTISPQIKLEKSTDEFQISGFDGKFMDDGKKLDNKGPIVVNPQDQAVVQLKGLPKDVTLHEIAGLFGEKSFNLKLSSIKMEYTSDGVPNGNASILFQSRADAECIIRTADSVLLRGYRVQVRIMSKR
ncbi:unnamed protein product, partial [Echinostoma caproni]|uniref:RRM domain-containing protein n=1 Tax=Echinostoma caproni TaxID=27848 RepID=A0A183AHF2_9TREM